MEYVEGRTLKELIVSRGPCPVPVAISYTRQILAALRYAHRNGIIHRDIKPHNVIVDREGRVNVADFGIARAGTSQMTEAGLDHRHRAVPLARAGARRARSTRAPTSTPPASSSTSCSPATVPFTGESPVEIAMKHLSQPPEPPSELRPEIPHDLDLVVLRALAKEPADRYRIAARWTATSSCRARRAGRAGDGERRHRGARRRRRARADDRNAGRPRTVDYGGDERYRAYDARGARASAPGGRGCSALGAVLALVVAGYFLYDNIQDQLAASEPVAVGDYEGLQEPNAVNLIVEDGFEPKVRRLTNGDTAGASSTSRTRARGRASSEEVDRDVLVSTGKPKVKVPDVVGAAATTRSRR